MPRPISVVLISPAKGAAHEGDFGSPHLVCLGAWLRQRTGATVELVDLEYERQLPRGDPHRVFSTEFDVVGISAYSSFDYLSAFYLGAEIRKHNPDAVLVAGGYHASARPGDFLNLPGSALEEASPFDHVVVGEGELPMERIVEAAARGERLSDPVLGPELVADLDELPPMDWSLLDRYLPLAQGPAGQAVLYFSRGCPFHCTFCMERAKGQAVWRAWSPARAEAELRRMNDWLGLRGWTLFVADAMFGLDAEWRREMLDRLAKLDVDLAKIWALTRMDQLRDGDVDRYAEARMALGMGLESGDPGMLAVMGKTRDGEAFLEKFTAFAAAAAKANLPWGANLIAGHPGETRESLHRSADFAQKLFLHTPGLTGFLSIDPFRLYPGSQVDSHLDEYVQRFGTHVHRPRWWNYSEQAFTSEWVDPSAELDYRTRESLTAELFEPIVRGVAGRFAYEGAGREYFRRSVERACEELGPASRLRTLADWHLWRGLTGRPTGGLAEDEQARALLRRERRKTVARIGSPRPDFDDGPLRQALVDEPRERYVPDEYVLESCRDVALPLTDDGRATLSAMHAYLTNYALLHLQPGDRLVEIGGGTGYGAATAGRIVGESGYVLSYEIIPELAEQAERNLADRANVTVICGDGLTAAQRPACNKILVTCAVARVPQACLDALPEGGRLVAPLLTGADDNVQILTRFVRTDGQLVRSEHGPVLYVSATGGGSA